MALYIKPLSECNSANDHRSACDVDRGLAEDSHPDTVDSCWNDIELDVVDDSCCDASGKRASDANS